VRRRADVPWRRVGAEVVIARPGRDDFDLLRGEAASVWLALEQPSSLTELSDALAGAGVADPSIVLCDLAERGLIDGVPA
jgi:hypothetical protein